VTETAGYGLTLLLTAAPLYLTYKVYRAGRESEARQGVILEAAQDAIITMDHQLNIREFNPAAERMFGRTRAETIGRPIGDLLQPSGSVDAAERPFTVAAAARAGHRLEMTARHAGGSRFPVELALSRIRAQGTVQFAGVVRDISERKSHEAATLERNRLSAFARDVGIAFTESVSLAAMLELCAQLMVAHLGAALARKRTGKPAKDDPKMTEAQLTDFAATPTTDLPEKVKKGKKK
jgi:PAS domain S-box-containing protein